MPIVTAFPHAVRVIESAFIPLADGARLAATIWLPVDAERAPVPAILEYLPYRRRDGTYERDCLNHPYFAGHGYAAVRVDMRGSGDSDGVLTDEYLPQEQNDAVEVIAWLARQPWCSGAVGMIGISWGGFNGLQVAARRPPALKAVISLCSTDDRYCDDIHAMGGAFLTDQITWAPRMMSLNAAPPDPAVVGERWRTMWQDRLENGGVWLATWLAHQRRDAYYAQGSVCEDWAAIACPVYAVGGWADAYTNAIFRLLANLQSPCKGLIGPWAHRYPHIALPGPRIGFLQECLRWWDHWLKGRDTGIMDEPRLRAWIEEPSRPAPHYDLKPGRWVAEEEWPSASTRHFVQPLLAGQIGAGAERETPTELTIASPLTTGLAAGKWCPYGQVPDQPLDQRLEAGGSLLFDGPIITESFDVLGAPVLDLMVSSDRPNALIAATLCEVFPDGAATRVSYGLLNLTHRESHAEPEPLEPGRFYRVRLQLNDIGHRFGVGNRLRIALSTAYWPLAWPSPEFTTVTVRTVESTLSLPLRTSNAADASLAPFAEPEHAAPGRVTPLVAAAPAWTITHDVVTGETTTRRVASDGTRRIEAIDLETGFDFGFAYRIRPGDPASARIEAHGERHYRRGAWLVRAVTDVTVACDRDAFILTATLDAFEGETCVFRRAWSHRIPRDHV